MKIVPNTKWLGTKFRIKHHLPDVRCIISAFHDGRYNIIITATATGYENSFEQSQEHVYSNFKEGEWIKI